MSSASTLPEDAVAAARGFQPYRHNDEALRHSLAGLSSLDAYTYLAQAQAMAAAYPGNPYAAHPSLRSAVTLYCLDVFSHIDIYCCRALYVAAAQSTCLA